MTTNVDQAFIRQMQKKVEEELLRKEKEVLSYWRGELDKSLKRRHQDLASFASDLQALLAKMDKRLNVIGHV